MFSGSRNEGTCLLVPVEVPPTGARLLAKIFDAAGGLFWPKRGVLLGCEAPKLKIGADEALLEAFELSELAPKVKLGVPPPAPNVNGADEDWLSPLPKLKEVGAEYEPSEANGFLIVPSEPPAVKVNEALALPKIEPVVEGWLAVVF